MFKQFLPIGSTRRTVFLCVGTFLLLILFTQVLPKRTPVGVLVYALPAGAHTALLAAGLLIIYRSARIINFAQAALGAVGASVVFAFSGLLGWPFFVGLLLGLVAAILLGVIAEVLFIRRFFNSPRLVLTVITIVISSLLLQASQYVNRLPFLPDLNSPGLSQEIRLGRIPLPFPSLSFEIFPFQFGFGELFSVGIAIVAFVALGFFLQRTTLGDQIKGTSENLERALTLGINVGMLSTIVWGIAALMSALAAISQGMTQSFLAGSQSAQAKVLIPAIAACVLGRMRNLPVAIFAAFGISLLDQSLSWWLPGTPLGDVTILAVLGAGLLFQRKGILKVDEESSSSWEATKEIRPTPPELMEVSGLRRAKRIAIGLGIVILVVFPLASSQSQTNLASLIVIQAIVALSLVILTGWGGQISLAQWTFVAIAAVVGGKITSDFHISFFVALPVVCAFTAGFAALIGMPALRVKGPFLAVVSLAFAFAVETTLFNETLFEWLIPDSVERPRILFLSFGNERNYYYLVLLLGILAAILVKRLRASRPGRVLLAIREDDRGVQAFGINVARTRIAVFALSGMLTGLAGMLFVHHQRAIDAGSYGAQVSVDMFMMAMIGGVTSVSGALLGAAYVGLNNFFLTNPLSRQLTTSLGLLILLLVSPGGLAGLFYQARDGILRIIAARRQIIVPSLFEDFDPDAVARRKIPLAEPVEGQGINAVPLDRRYAVNSELYPKDDKGNPRRLLAVAGETMAQTEGDVA